MVSYWPLILILQKHLARAKLVCSSVEHLFRCLQGKEVIQGVLTGYAHGGLPALGGPQVTPCHTLAPIVLWPVEVLHLLPGDVDKYLPDLQA